MIDLDFTATHQAETFLAFLHDNVWSSHENAPALVGTPRTKILELLADH